MNIKNGLIFLLLVVMLVAGCKSRDEACLYELEESNIATSCTFWAISMRYVNFQDPKEREIGQNLASIMGSICAKYLYEQQLCHDKNGIPTKIY